MHDNGFIHNDLHAGNILLNNPDDPTFYYIDLNRGRIKKSLSKKQRMKDLARFKLKDREFKVLLKNYDEEKHQQLFNMVKSQRRRRRRYVNLKHRVRDFLGINK